MVRPRLSWQNHSNGETYNQYAMTAAHKILPLGTQVRVTHLGNGRSINVRINDRGPFVDDRVIDLSRAAATRLNVIGPGTARVRVQSLGDVERMQEDGTYVSVKMWGATQETDPNRVGSSAACDPDVPGRHLRRCHRVGPVLSVGATAPLSGSRS